SDPHALRFERVQAQIGTRPSLEAATKAVVLWVADISRETRWPQFVPRTLPSGVRIVLSVPSTSQGGSALSLYSGAPCAFCADAPTIPEPCAAHIRLVLGTFQVHEQYTAIVQQRRGGLESRTGIGQAHGILMQRQRITAQEAFPILRTESQHTNV